MAFVKAGSLAQLKPGTLLEFRNGEQQLALCNVEGEVHALDNHCPHRGGPLAQGSLHDAVAFVRVSGIRACIDTSSIVACLHMASRRHIFHIV